MSIFAFWILLLVPVRTCPPQPPIGEFVPGPVVDVSPAPWNLDTMHSRKRVSTS